MEITIIINIVSITIAIATFVLNRKDKAVKDAKETNLELINYRLNELDKNVQKILDKLESTEVETKKMINEEMQKHIAIYHSKGN